MIVMIVMIVKMMIRVVEGRWRRGKGVMLLRARMVLRQSAGRHDEGEEDDEIPHDPAICDFVPQYNATLIRTYPHDIRMTRVVAADSKRLPFIKRNPVSFRIPFPRVVSRSLLRGSPVQVLHTRIFSPLPQNAARSKAV